jgi:transcriptional regulator with XRE-family HTH domain
VFIGQRLREMREARKLSQGDIERRTGLFRSYISRVENGHNVPTVQTLEKYAQAFGVPVYELLHSGKGLAKKPPLPKADTAGPLWGNRRKELKELRLFTNAFSRMGPRNRRLLLVAAQWLASHSERSRASRAARRHRSRRRLA